MRERGPKNINKFNQKKSSRTREDSTFAVFAGREKLVHDTILMGKENFHINSEVSTE